MRRTARPLPILLLLGLLALAACGDAPDGTRAGSAARSAAVDTATDTLAAIAPQAGETSLENLRTLRKPWTGDLDGMEKRRVIRLLTVYGPGRYYLEDNGQEKGIVKELAVRLENFVNRRLGKQTVRVHVVIVPISRGQLMPALAGGYGDIIAAGLTVTGERQRDVDFSAPFASDVSEVLVTGPEAPPLEGLESLAGQTVYVRASSSYRESLEALNRKFAAKKLEPVDIEPVSEYLEDEDLVEMVDRGLLPWMVVDDYKLAPWKEVFGNITVRRDIVLREGGRIGWAFRKGSPQLVALVNDFLRANRQGTLIGNVLINRYVRDLDWEAVAMEERDYQRFFELQHLFEKYGEQYQVDALLAAAQGFQESRLDQSKRSASGAIGVMQILPSTARDRNVGIPNIHQVEPNIHAGIKYVAFLRERYFSGPEIDRLNATLLALAAYNAGPARVAGLRAKAAELGYDPNVWFDNVELVAAKKIGRETVEYVANIFKYYVAYRAVVSQQAKHAAARRRAGIDGESG